MNKHEQRNCLRCQLLFECKPGNIMQCQCNAIQLSVEERVYIETKVDDCLCINCLIALQKEYILFNEKNIYK